MSIAVTGGGQLATLYDVQQPAERESEREDKSVSLNLEGTDSDVALSIKPIIMPVSCQLLSKFACYSRA